MQDARSSSASTAWTRSSPKPGWPRAPCPTSPSSRAQGHYQPLPTTNPAQSPVAWSSFATGLNPGAHGIFDFLSRNPQTYGPDYSISSVDRRSSFCSAFGCQLPLDSGAIPTAVSARRSGSAPSARVTRPRCCGCRSPIRPIRSPGCCPAWACRICSARRAPSPFYTTEAAEGDDHGRSQILTSAPTATGRGDLRGPADPFWVEPDAHVGAARRSSSAGGEVGSTSTARRSSWRRGPGATG